MEKNRFITDKNGKKVAIVLPINKFKKMNEDLHDLAVIAERKNEELVSFDDVKGDLPLAP